MKWQNEKTTLSESPARADVAVHHSSATHSPKTNNIIENKPDQKTHHQHKWGVSDSVWKCSACGRTYG